MKERLDILLVKKGLAPSREKAKTMIMEGNVFVDNNREDKAGSSFDEYMRLTSDTDSSRGSCARMSVLSAWRRRISAM